MEIFVVEIGGIGQYSSVRHVLGEQDLAILRAKEVYAPVPWEEHVPGTSIGVIYFAHAGKQWVSVRKFEVYVSRSDDDIDPKIRNAYRETAVRLFSDDGELEIDGNAIVSRSDDGGAYVAAWVWVDDSDANVCTECRAELTDDGEGYDGKCGNCMDKEDPA